MVDTAEVIKQPVVAPHAVAAPPVSPSHPEPRVAKDEESSKSHRDSLLYGLIFALILGAYGVTRLNLYTTKSDFAYWLGVAGGIGMLLLLSYPMRKHWRFMQHWGQGQAWFVGHMVLGVCGPLLIVLHSNFDFGSLNATVAFISMAIVALSGVIGRFLYLQVHRNLRGQKNSLEQLRDMMGSNSAAASRLRFAPVVVERCKSFEGWAVERPMVSSAELLRAMVAVPLMRWRTQINCRGELRRRLVAVAHTEAWSRRKFNARLRAARKLTDAYLGASQRVAMFAAWERLFSWWHVAHVPFVYILVLSAVVHVIAVHAY
jgi:hypothetical protein